MIVRTVTFVVSQDDFKPDVIERMSVELITQLGDQFDSGAVDMRPSDFDLMMEELDESSTSYAEPQADGDDGEWSDQ